MEDGQPGNARERQSVIRLPGLALISVLAVALAGSWWFSLRVLADTPVVDITLPKLAILAGICLLPLVRAWRLPAQRDWPVLSLGAALLIWLVAAAALRGNAADLKGVLAFAVFGGGAFAVAFVAVRHEGNRAIVLLLGLVAAAAAVTFSTVVLERLVYRPGATDAFEWLWALARPSDGFVDPVLGAMSPPPDHFEAGTVLRASGLFAHVNYLAFFALLVGPLFAIRCARALEAHAWRSFGLNAMLLAATTLCCLWTYSRTGVLGFLAMLALAIAVERLAARGPARRPALLPAVATAAVVAAALGLGIAQDTTAAQRVVAIGSISISLPGSATTTAEPAASPTPTPEPGTPEDVRETALRSEAIRMGMQRAAVDMMLDSPASAAIGPGLNAYGKATHDPSDPLYQSQAENLRDPNSMWLTFGLAGGLPAIGLVLALVLATFLAVARAALRATGVRREAALWLAVWLPVWTLCQFFGTNPFTTSEAVQMGAFLGLAAALCPARTNQPDR